MSIPVKYQAKGIVKNHINQALDSFQESFDTIFNIKIQKAKAGFYYRCQLRCHLT